MTNPLIVHAPDGSQSMEFEREFDYPVAALFQAHAEPELVAQWLGPYGSEWEIEHFDFRTGGGFRYLSRAGDQVHAFNGVFHRVRENQLVIQTFEYEGFPDLVNLETLVFDDLGDGRCRLSGRSVAPTVEAAKAWVDSGAERGMREGYERLDALLGSQQG
jgi:uncharacterized protein YndB with AHSA1/START domain